MSGARPMEIVATTELMSVSNVFVFFHYLLWKAKLDLTALSEDLDSWSLLTFRSVRVPLPPVTL